MTSSRPHGDDADPQGTETRVRLLARALNASRLQGELAERGAAEAEAGLSLARKKIDEIWGERTWFKTELNRLRNELAELGLTPAALSDHIDALRGDGLRSRTSLALAQATLVLREAETLAASHDNRDTGHS